MAPGVELPLQGLGIDDATQRAAILAAVPAFAPRAPAPPATEAHAPQNSALFWRPCSPPPMQQQQQPRQPWAAAWGRAPAAAATAAASSCEQGAHSRDCHLACANKRALVSLAVQAYTTRPRCALACARERAVPVYPPCAGAAGPSPRAWPFSAMFRTRPPEPPRITTFLRPQPDTAHAHAHTHLHPQTHAHATGAYGQAAPGGEAHDQHGSAHCAPPADARARGGGGGAAGPSAWNTKQPRALVLAVRGGSGGGGPPPAGLPRWVPEHHTLPGTR
jgi:hypothetical protein